MIVKLLIKMFFYFGSLKLLYPTLHMLRFMANSIPEQSCLSSQGKGPCGCMQTWNSGILHIMLLSEVSTAANSPQITQTARSVAETPIIPSHVSQSEETGVAARETPLSVPCQLNPHATHERLHMALCQIFYALCKPAHITKPQQFAQMFSCSFVNIKNNKHARLICIMLQLKFFFFFFATDMFT